MAKWPGITCVRKCYNRIIEMNISECPAYEINIYIAGDLSRAKELCERFCLHGFCVSVYETEFIYTFGRQTGAMVKIINYARFPRTKEYLQTVAWFLAGDLMEGLCQGSLTLQTPEKSYFVSRRGEQESLSHK